MKKPSKNTIIFVLADNNWDRKVAAKALNCSERTLNNWIAEIKKGENDFSSSSIKRKNKDPKKDPFECKCFPTNEYRLEALDRPKGPGAPKYNLWSPDED